MSTENIKSCGGIIAKNGCCEGKMIQLRQYEDTGMYFCECSCGKSRTGEFLNPIEAFSDYWKLTADAEYQSEIDRIVKHRLSRERAKREQNNQRVIDSLKGTIRMINIQG